MRVDGDINGSILTQAPCCPRHAEMVCDKRFNVGVLCSEIAGVAEPTVVRHVDDEWVDLARA